MQGFGSCSDSTGFYLTLTHVFVIPPDASLLFILTALPAEKGGHATVKYKDMYNMDTNFSYKAGSSGRRVLGC